ncbi:MAG TPA: nuclear transport factor 2 family protein [Pyrinomonadaceae bacterium]|nr:nuclear transport factor 2 family protein [Pyrinomonadaceae bacterium]
MNNLLLVLIALSLCFSGCQNMRPLNDEEQLRQLVKQIAEAQIAGDKATLEKVLANDYTEKPLYGGSMTKAQVIAAVKPLKGHNVSFPEMNVVINGDKAVVTGRTEDTIEMGGSAGKWTEKWTFTSDFEKRNGVWLAVKTVHK